MSLPSLDHLIGYLLRGLSRFQLGKEARGHQIAGGEHSVRIARASASVVLAILVSAALAEALGLGVIRAIHTPIGQVLF